MNLKRTLSIILTLIPLAVPAQDGTLYDNFRNPPADCRPRVWWHWMNGNISKDGIRKDLLWMKEAGVGGVQVFDAGLDVPQIVPERVAFMTEPWKEAYGYAAQLADSLGFEFATACAGGWSDTGAPWVTPEEAMKTLNWKEFTVDGGRPVSVRLPEPNVVCGKYLSHSFFAEHHPEYDFYRDIAVIAVKIPGYDRSVEEMGGVIRTSDGTDAATLLNGDINDVCLVRPGRDGYAWIEFSFPRTITVRSFFCARKDDWEVKNPRHLEVSADGTHYTRVDLDFPPVNIPFLTLDIPESEGRYFRFVSDVEGEPLDYTEFRVYTTTRVNLDTEKAGFFNAIKLYNRYGTPAFADATGVEDVLDLTSSVHDGVLDWNAPEGRWRVFRFGYNVRGRRNNPASPEATGLETDKLDPAVTAKYYRWYIDKLNEACNGKAGTALKYIMIDSFEAGCQTWTADMPSEFLSRRGYDLIPWLPALAGHVIGSSEMTERFLQDWKRTLGEMLVDNHYNVVDPILKSYGLKRYTEFHESGKAFPADGFEVKRNADIPMGAFWPDEDSLIHYRYHNDIRESASVAHFYGQNLVAAESFTTDGDIRDRLGRSFLWDAFPVRLKGGADLALANGLNTFVIHCSPHQPADDKVPGVSLSKYGSWFQRHETWAHEARAWTDYLARSSYMLRQGRFVADIAYFFDETVNTTDRFNDELPAIPEGYAFDYVNRNMIANPAFNYHALMIDPEVRAMSVEALRSVKALADRGVVIAGSEPGTYLGLSGRDDEFRALVKSIWHSGRENVVPFDGAGTALEAAGFGKDVEFLKGGNGELRFVHRKCDDCEIYWIGNPRGAVDVTAAFSVSGRVPRLLDAATGSVEALPYSFAGGRTLIDLSLGQRDAAFIVFDEPTAVPEVTAPQMHCKSSTTVSTPWKISFQAGRGAPESVKVRSLAPLSEFADPGVRYFSGTATYSTVIRLPRPVPGSKYVLRLGRLHSMARVRVNGVDCGLLWNLPFETDVTSLLRKGRNRLEIEVTNGWFNRLLGDAQPGAKPITWAEPSFVKADDLIHPSGLVGPVQIVEFAY